LGEQLRVQAEGLTGFLDEIWQDVGENSAWLGGNGENWERGPYYLDGLVPLAYLTGDERLQNKATRWIESILSSQDQTGFFGPQNNEDWWPRMVALKVLTEYYEATNDDRVLSFMGRYFKYESQKLHEQPLFMWAVARAGENVLSTLWLLDKTSNEELIDLSERLLDSSLDWASFFRDVPYKKPMQNYLDWGRMEELRRRYGPLEIAKPSEIPVQEARELFGKYHYSHGVNIAMALKYPALRYRLSGDESYLASVKKGLADLASYHGQIHGLYSCDEHLNGKQPYTGVELCTVVEAMFSFENLIQITGDTEFADMLERLSFNALPATISADYSSHQYDQQVNQVLCSIDKRDWYNNTDTSNIFGLEPHFGCCLANMHQGWPKFVRSLWLKDNSSEDAIVVTAMTYAPSSLSFTVADSEVTIDEDTNYPFAERIAFRIKTQAPDVHFGLSLRIPGWCEKAQLLINGEKVEEPNRPLHTIRRNWSDGDEVILQLRMPALVRRDDATGGAFVTKGPVLYALPISGDWRKAVDRGRFSDYEVYPNEEWAYALVIDHSHLIDTIPNGDWNGLFDENDPPELVELHVRSVSNWSMYHNSAGPLPAEPECVGDTKRVRLVPYGATTLRIALFPVCED